MLHIHMITKPTLANLMNRMRLLNKELQEITNYLKFDLVDPTEEGQIVDFMDSETFEYDENGNEKRTSYSLDTYKARRIK